jgi:hypothetical protein
MIDVRQRGESIEITDTPSSLAMAMSWLARISLWLGIAFVGVGVVTTILAIVRGAQVGGSIGMVGQAAVLAVFGWASRRGWQKLATTRRTVIDRARGSIELAESSPGGTPHSRSELLAEVVDIAIESCETRGPERSPLRLVRLWLRLAGDRRMLLGDVGDSGGEKRSLERAAGLVAGFLGVAIARESTHDAAPENERVVTPRVAGVVSRSWPMLTLRQRLLYVPGIALILCGTTYVVLVVAQHFGGDAAELARARMFVLAISPMMLILPAIPMLAFGGTMHAIVEAGRLQVVRSRAGVRGAPIVMTLGTGVVSLRIHAFVGRRMRGYGRLVATQDGRDTVLVHQASLPALGRVADGLAAMLDGSS